MKKSILTMLIASLALVLAVASCKCSSDNQKEEVANLVVENTVSTDKEDMFLNYGRVYEYFETSIMLKNFLDEEECDGSIECIVNTFMDIKKVEGQKDIDTDVVQFTHSEKLDTVEVVPHTPWFGDFQINDEEINLTFAEAFERFMEANCPKPHSQYVVLRKPVGPQVTNVLYIFGNPADHWYVDAKTGEVYNDDPGYKWYDSE